MEGRMTLCNMAIEAGARIGLIGVDQKTIDYVRGRPFAPTGDSLAHAETYWRTLVSDPDARFARTVKLDASRFRPMVTWGTSPDMVVAVDQCVPNPDDERDASKRPNMSRALKHIGLI